MSIGSFYANQEILITGGTGNIPLNNTHIRYSLRNTPTGFIGKVTIEKILRSLPNFDKIYVLIRTKRGKNAHDRLQEILNLPVFRRAREEQPESFKKVVAIAGDCQELGLGISAADLEKIRNVTLIFHVAATVRFDEDLRTSILLNTRGTLELVKIAETLPNLKAFMHVSTTYAHPDYPTMEEKIYPPYADWRTAIKLAETYDADTLNILFPKYAPHHYNTYTFTKSLSEHIIDDYRHKLPVTIFRPSIVISSVEEPFPGYIDNFNGPMGILIASGIGIMRSINCNPDNRGDLIYVDVCAKALLVAAYKFVTQPVDNGGELEIFNCSSTANSSLRVEEIINVAKKAAAQNPFEKCIWLPDGIATRSAVWHYIRLITLQIIPAILLDCLIRLAKHPPLVLKLQRRIHDTSKVLNVYFNTEWQFVNNNLRALDKLIEDGERSIFSFLIPHDFDYQLYYSNAVRGAKEFLLNEKPEASPQTRLRVKIYRVLHYLFQIMGLFYIVRFILKRLI